MDIPHYVQEEKIDRLSQVQNLNVNLHRKSQLCLDDSIQQQEQLTQKFEEMIIIIKQIEEIISYFIDQIKDNYILKQFMELVRYLKILENQIRFLLNIYIFNDDIDEISKIRQSYSILQNYFIDIHSKMEICEPVTHMISDFIFGTLLLEINLLCEKYLICQKNTNISCIQFLEKNFPLKFLFQLKENQQMILTNKIKIIYSKLKCLIEFMPIAIKFDQKDLFAQNKNSQSWKQISMVVQTKELDDILKVRKNFQRFVQTIHLANAMMSFKTEFKGELMQNIAQMYGAIYYFIDNDAAQFKANLLYADPSHDVARSVLDLPENFIVKNSMKMILPFIEFNRKIYIDYLYKPITLQSINSELKEQTVNKINPFYYDNLIDCHQYDENLFIFDENKIQIRILNWKALKTSQELEQMKNRSIIQKMSSIYQDLNFYDFHYNSLIIHVHGGGFISMSSRVHQNYTRKWANNINVPIFSIDYKKAPEYKYPYALNDVWQSYNWIINNCEKVFRIIPKKIILAGDSAGGNLVTALTLRCIKEKIRVPDGLLLAYPALNLSQNSFTPSFIHAIQDQIIPQSYLKMCLELYLGDKQADSQLDPFISPLFASDELLRNFPTTRIVCGDIDPLHDDCIRFTERLQNLNIDVKTTIYKQMPHGFLSYDSLHGLPEATKCVQEASDLLKELLQQN